MKTKLSKFAAIIFAGFLGLAALFAPVPSVSAIADPCSADLPEEIKAANGCSGSSTTDTIDTTIIGILDAVILIAGTVAVVFIVIGGIQYTTSLGDAGKVKKAKDTILYALIGVVVCALAYVIVNWVIGSALKQSASSSEGETTSLVIDEISTNYLI